PEASALRCRGQGIVVALQARRGLILWQSLVVDQTGEILTISILHQRTRQVPQLRSGNESHSVSNFFRAGKLHALTLFDRLDKRSSVNERFKCSRIEPCEAASHPRDFECPGAQVLHVEIRDLISNSPRLEGLTSAAYRTTSLS